STSNYNFSFLFKDGVGYRAYYSPDDYSYSWSQSRTVISEPGSGGGIVSFVEDGLYKVLFASGITAVVTYYNDLSRYGINTDITNGAEVFATCGEIYVDQDGQRYGIGFLLSY